MSPASYLAAPPRSGPRGVAGSRVVSPSGQRVKPLVHFSIKLFRSAMIGPWRGFASGATMARSP